jgi:hypothetical protein
LLGRYAQFHPRRVTVEHAGDVVKAATTRVGRAERVDPQRAADALGVQVEPQADGSGRGEIDLKTGRRGGFGSRRPGRGGGRGGFAVRGRAPEFGLSGTARCGQLE